jgi:hypothetical protein
MNGTMPGMEFREDIRLISSGACPEELTIKGEGCSKQRRILTKFINAGKAQYEREAQYV